MLRLKEIKMSSFPHANYDSRSGERMDPNRRENLTLPVATSRDLTSSDDGYTLECTATVTLNIPAGLPANFGCAIIPNGITSISASGGALLNGAGTTLTRAASANALFAIVSRVSAANSYVVTGS